MAEIDAGADHIAFDYTDSMNDLFVDPESNGPIQYKKILFVGKEKTVEKAFDGVEVEPYVFSGKTYELIEYPGQGLLWSYCVVFFK